MAAEKQPRRLGRGLEALLGNAGGLATSDDGTLKSVPIAQVSRNPFQPRQEFDPQELTELQESLKGSGLLQPITVRRRPGRDGFELIAGERRLRAATQLGWKEIPAIIKDIDDKTLLTLALVENLQRADLNPIEEGQGYNRLAQEFGLTQLEIADTVGKNRTTVSNMLRVLQLPEAVRSLLENRKLSLGHAKVLLGLEDPHQITELAQSVVTEGLTVRQLEQRLRDMTGPKLGKKAGRPRSVDNRTPEVKSIENRLRKLLQTDVSITTASNNKGLISIQFYSADDLDRVLGLLGLTD